ncbi:large ribosomal subunit protein mL62 isoform X2 [Ranitomeya variabilis]|uniref:large ribosomal subunit protein mL62 isoform X2 n=1 Tax=Ranitomeya variabilis TaxID=490064 RepID=UPI0040570B97
MATAAWLPRLSVFRALGPLSVRSSSCFQSAYSLDKLYPESSNRTSEVRRPDLIDIPVDRLTISYSKSSGPGGQNVNKADWIPEDVREKVSVQNKNRINRNGELIVTSEVSRYQMRNLADCLDKIRSMISEAKQKPKPVSKEDVELRQMRLENANRERLRQKKMNSSVKQSRSISLD